jgi:hypothetical protein
VFELGYDFVYEKALLWQRNELIRVITKIPNSEQSSKGKVKTHTNINRQNGIFVITLINSFLCHSSAFSYTKSYPSSNTRILQYNCIPCSLQEYMPANYKLTELKENCENRNDPDLVQAFSKKWLVESDSTAPNLPLSLRFKGSGCHCNSIYFPFGRLFGVR